MTLRYLVLLLALPSSSGLLMPGATSTNRNRMTTTRPTRSSSSSIVTAMADAAAAPAAEEDFLTSEKIAELVDAAFVPAVMGISRGDVTELKLFVAAAQAGYTLDEPIDALCKAMTGLKVQAAGRPLMAEEEALRRLWVSLIYLTLERLAADGDGGQGSSGSSSEGGKTSSACVPSDIRASNEPFVANLIAAKRSGRALSECDIDEMLTSRSSSATSDDDAPAAAAAAAAAPPSRDAVERAVLQQSMRVVYLTVDVVEDEKLAGTRADAGPKIPGTRA